MPYVSCPACDLRVFSAARYSTRDTCPYCTMPLPTPADREPRVRALTQATDALRQQRSRPRQRPPL
jgi:hypothetical protein